MISANNSIFNPLVSIIIPVFNGENFLDKAITSALSQTYKNIEIIIVNDGSNDEGKTRNIANSFGQKIKYFEKENGGCGSALNLGIEKMKGEYFSWLSHDDLYHPLKIERQIKKLSQLIDKHTVLYGDFNLIDEKGNRTGSVLIDQFLPREKRGVPLYPLLNGLIHGCTLLIHRDIFHKIGIFDETKRTTQDYALWFDILRKYPIAHCEGLYVDSRIHPGQDTQKISALHLRECDELWIDFIKKLTPFEMTSLEGSEYAFLDKMSTHLKLTPYSGAQHFAENLCREFIARIGVTTVIPADNNSKEIFDSLKSLECQEHENLDVIIIIKDKSTKFINAILKEFERSKLNITVQELNSTNFFSTSLGILNTIKTDYLNFMMPGDIFYSQKIAAQLRYLEKNNSHVVACNFEYLNINEPGSQPITRPITKIFENHLAGSHTPLCVFMTSTKILKKISNGTNNSVITIDSVKTALMLEDTFNVIDEILIGSPTAIEDPASKLINLINAHHYFSTDAFIKSKENDLPISGKDKLTTILHNLQIQAALTAKICDLSLPKPVAKKYITETATAQAKPKRSLEDLEGTFVEIIKPLLPPKIYAILKKPYPLFRLLIKLAKR